MAKQISDIEMNSKKDCVRLQIRFTFPKILRRKIYFDYDIHRYFWAILETAVISPTGNDLSHKFISVNITIILGEN